MNMIAAKAVAFHEALQPEFAQYQQQVIINAQAMAQEFKNLGYRIVADGTDNHLFIVDLRSVNLTGKTAQTVLEKAGIIISRSTIPFDPQPGWITSGIRVGTPAISTRGMKTDAAVTIVHYIDKALRAHDNEAELANIKQQVKKLALQYPIYS